MQKYSWDFVESWVEQKTSPVSFKTCIWESQHKSQSSPSKLVAMYVFMSYLGHGTWDFVWSGKSQLPCSQWLRLDILTSSDLGLRTWKPSLIPLSLPTPLEQIEPFPIPLPQCCYYIESPPTIVKCHIHSRHFLTWWKKSWTITHVALHNQCDGKVSWKRHKFGFLEKILIALKFCLP